MSDVPRISFLLIGAGWRSEFYLRVAKALPSRFEVCGLVDTIPGKAAETAARWGIPGYAGLPDALRAGRPHFAVSAVPPQATPAVIEEAAELELPILVETPPALDIETLARLDGLVRTGARVQVAEQYHRQPVLAAQIAVAHSGRLGEVNEARVSVGHDYHGVSVLRKLLGVGFADATIRASRFETPLVAGPTRAGDPTTEELIASDQTLALLDFGTKFGMYDFAVQHYRSWIRSTRVLVRGSRGEIDGTRVTYLKDFRTPMVCELRRISTGEGTNQEGHYLRGLAMGEEWIYRNEFAPARFMDDEIALASCLAAMGEYVDGGPGPYSLAEASQDQYLQLLIQQACDTGQPVHSTRQAWAV